MSLDVYLLGLEVKVVHTLRCPDCWTEHNHDAIHEPQLYWANITHNLNKMADEAGIYHALWRPEELPSPATRASDLISLLERGLIALKKDPNHFRTFNPSNGWGDYSGLVTFVENYLAACKEFPEARIRVSR
jgi:hypothetical protein